MKQYNEMIETLKAEIKNEITLYDIADRKEKENWNNFIWNKFIETNDQNYFELGREAIIERDEHRDKLDNLRLSLYYLRQAAGQESHKDFDGRKPEIEF